MRQLKQTLDPHGILNPYKTIPSAAAADWLDKMILCLRNYSLTHSVLTSWWNREFLLYQNCLGRWWTIRSPSIVVCQWLDFTSCYSCLLCHYCEISHRILYICVCIYCPRQLWLSLWLVCLVGRLLNTFIRHKTTRLQTLTNYTQQSNVEKLHYTVLKTQSAHTLDSILKYRLSLKHNVSVVVQ